MRWLHGDYSKKRIAAIAMHSACQPEVPGGLPVMLDTNPAMKALRSEAWRGLSRAPARGAATERVVPR